MCLAPLLLLLSLASTAEPVLNVAIRQGSEDKLYHLTRDNVVSEQPLPATLSTPLGSLWKLYVYAWLADQQAEETPYTCHGADKEEIYCCNAGETITRDQALVRSCGLYFSPDRLQINRSDWQQYWQKRHAPDWLQQLTLLQPETRVSVTALLNTLATLPARQSVQALLLDVVLNNGQGTTAGALGGRLRVKTWSWFADDARQQRVGGFAGWLSDGTPLWASGPGTSKTVLNDYARVLNQSLPLSSTLTGEPCVVVDLFTRYPINSLRLTGSDTNALPGVLRGRYLVSFANGNQREIESQGELYLQQDMTLKARLNREEYVARVLDREAKSEPQEAAKAMSVAIRTYLQQNAQRSEECLTIQDSSALQRVSPFPASEGSKAIVAWTQDIVLAGSLVNYHLDTGGENQLAWQQAVEQARQGMRYDAILASAYPRANLSRWDAPQTTCQALPEAEAWITARQQRWREKLYQEPGYKTLKQFAVCRLGAGSPYIDRTKKQIHIRNFYTLQDRLDLTHEYLHLAFDGYPSGMDEQYIETLTRHLLMD